MNRRPAVKPMFSLAPVVFRNSAIQGRGVFARRRFSPGEFIVPYAPKQQRLDVRDPRAAEAAETKLTLLSGDEVIIPDTAMPGGWLCDHSCSPNAALYSSGAGRIQCTRPIAPGQEITIFYGWVSHNEPERNPCRCGTEGCRGFINFDLSDEDATHVENPGRQGRRGRRPRGATRGVREVPEVNRAGAGAGGHRRDARAHEDAGARQRGLRLLTAPARSFEQPPRAPPHDPARDGQREGEGQTEADGHAHEEVEATDRDDVDVGGSPGREQTARLRLVLEERAEAEIGRDNRAPGPHAPRDAPEHALARGHGASSGPDVSSASSRALPMGPPLRNRRRPGDADGAPKSSVVR